MGLRKTTCGSIGMSRPCSIRLVAALSISTADAIVRMPVYGTSAVSSSPWIWPSSPVVPWNASRATSKATAGGCRNRPRSRGINRPLPRAATSGIDAAQAQPLSVVRQIGRPLGQGLAN